MGIEILVFEVEGQQFGVRSADVVQVLRAASLSPLPQAPEAIEGVLNLRGSLVPVLDTRRLLGLPAKVMQHTDHLIVVIAAGQVVTLRRSRYESGAFRERPNRGGPGGRPSPCDRFCRQDFRRLGPCARPPTLAVRPGRRGNRQGLGPTDGHGGDPVNESVWTEAGYESVLRMFGANRTGVSAGSAPDDAAGDSLRDGRPGGFGPARFRAPAGTR